MVTKRRKLIFLTFFCLYKYKTNKRKFWIHPFNIERDNTGYYNIVRKKIEKFPDRFHKLFRMTPQVFNLILNLVKTNLQSVGTNYRQSISPKEKLCVTLIFLAHGGSFRKLAIDFRLGATTVRIIIKETCKVINVILEPIFLPPKTTEEWIKIRTDFHRLWQMPNCAGALDGKHIYLFKPRNTGSKFHNYKKTFSIVLMAVCGAQYKFTMVDIGAYGSSSDGGIFSSSAFGKAWLNKDPALQLPPDRHLPGTTVSTPLALVADEAFPLRSNLLRPYGGKQLTEKQKIFNYRLSRARRTIKNAFGILAQTFRLLLSRMILQPKVATTIVKTCTILHNIIRDQQKLPERNVILSPNEGSSHNPKQAIAIRDAVATWFTKEGKLDYQDDHI